MGTRGSGVVETDLLGVVVGAVGVIYGKSHRRVSEPPDSLVRLLVGEILITTLSCRCVSATPSIRVLVVIPHHLRIHSGDVQTLRTRGAVVPCQYHEYLHGKCGFTISSSFLCCGKFLYEVVGSSRLQEGLCNPIVCMRIHSLSG
mmetsp:Transcript_913/g.2380  ORF Transcript_913/g.2380 Transcript_913/m.2380 type:complete len:145 (+) Transcript_913:1271-1705(+)